MTIPAPLPRLATFAAAFAATASAFAAPVAGVAVVPSFHMAPAALAEPADIDAGGTNLSALAAPTVFRVEAAQRGLSTARLTPRELGRHLSRARALSAEPFATGITAAVFTPAQIRAAYGLPELPALGATLSAAAAATLGAGQTIYIVDSNHNPNALADLNRFSTKFGLPGCTGVAPAVPMPAAGTAGCSFAVAYADGSGGMRSTAPAYDSGWASEIALDVQWAHAIAPRARIVLIEAANSMSNQLAGAVALANHMGPGVVSMSFGAPEGSWMAGVDANFTTAGMTYLAASGDDGATVNWPAASSHVLAVGGTSLAWAGGGTRHEVAWSGSGGGVSAYMALPAWQAGLALPGTGALARRTVSDVAFNADPFTGQYVAVTAPGASTTDWNAYGGTSIAAPQWAGIVAIANAVRATVAKERLGDFHATIYRSIAAVPGNYAAAFADITDGNDGACANCRAAIGFDQPTGLGTPKVAGLLPLLTGVAAAPPVMTAPVVPGGAFSTHGGASFTQSLGIAAPAGVRTTYRLDGVPTGLVVTDAGVLRWASAVVGSYSFSAIATTASNVSASARYTLAVAADRAPVFSGGRFSATTAAGFGARVTAVDPDGDALTYTMTGNPADLMLSSAGALSWAHPLAGTYTLRITAHDAAGLATTATYALAVTAVAVAPVVTPTTFAGHSGSPMIVQMVASDANGDALSWSLGDAPAGMTISTTGRVSWPSPTLGTRSVTVRAADSGGLVGSAILAVRIASTASTAFVATPVVRVVAPPRRVAGPSRRED